ncbi:hypothetical protein AHAS_Ahas17G0143800 [Arachis hypogaea]
MDPMNLDSKSDLLRPVIVVAISLFLCPIISMTTLFTTPIASFSFFSEPMFSNYFNFHMSSNSHITHCTDSLDARSNLSANLDSEKEGMKHLVSISNEVEGESSHDVLMSNNLYYLSKSGERRALE